MKRLGIYVHIPFCEHKCTYCDFNSGYALEEVHYLKALIREIENASSSFLSHEINTIFFGGGTPSLYTPNSHDKILSSIFKKFKVNASCEITMECNPNSLSFEKLKDFHAAGFNRMSLGAQSFNPSQLKTLTRIHSRDQIIEAVSHIKRSGFSNFNIDLMFGLTEQSLEEFENDLKMALSLESRHISFYNLTLPKQHPLFSRLPHDEHCRTMFLKGENILHKSGFIHYETSNYALPGFECRHNLKYWHMEEYLGVGAGACSYLETCPQWIPQSDPCSGHIRLSNIKTPESYVKSIKDQQHACANFENLTNDQAFTDYLIGRLRILEPLPLGLWKERFGMGITQTLRDILLKHHNLGLLNFDSDKLYLTDKGRLFLDEILIDFVNLNTDS